MKWMNALLVGGAAVTAAVGVVVGGDAGGARTGAADRVVVRGRATLDGTPFDAPYLGAVVERRGLVTPCQQALPPVRNGRFSITVFARTEASGCGAPGGRISLWTFVHDRIVYSEQSVPWPGNGGTARFRPRFASGSPDGGVGPVVGFAGEVSDGRHGRLAAGGEGRGVHRRDPVRGRDDPTDRRLRRLQHRCRGPDRRSRLRDRRDDHVPGRRPGCEGNRRQPARRECVVGPVPALRSARSRPGRALIVTGAAI